MRDKNGVEIRVGDWVTTNGVTAAKVTEVTEITVCCGASWRDNRANSREYEIVSRKPPKRRKLTLSQGLAWLEGQMLLVYGNGGNDWRVRKISGDEGDLVSEGGETLLKAIIAARKALGVKGGA